jgi:hypothetical protein
MARSPFELNIRVLPPHDPAAYVVGMTMVGCLQHEQIVWTLERDGWRCPICGFAPTKEAERAPLVVKSIDHRSGTIVIG